MPTEFKNLLVHDDDSTAKGNIYTYSTMPTKLNQVTSTTATNVSSMETAFTVAVRALTKGMGGGADLASFDRVAGAVEAMETNPIVVGFSSQKNPYFKANKVCKQPYEKNTTICKSETEQISQVGWIFGPQARLNPSERKIELIHSLNWHPVAADISAPGWWPWIQINSQAAWIGNWHNSGAMIRDMDKTKHIEHQHNLVQNRSDWDSLSNYLFQKLQGTSINSADIRGVEPYYLSACQDKVTLKILGSNLWRGASATLSGHPSESIRILPNMEGIAATFNIAEMIKNKNLLNTAGSQQHLQLMVSTRDGNVDKDIPFEGIRYKEGSNTVCKSITSLAASKKPNRLAIISVSPVEVSGCRDDVAITVKLDQISSKANYLEFFLDGQHSKQSKFNLPPAKMEKPKWGVFTANFNTKKIIGNESNKKVELTIKDCKELEEGEEGVEGCINVARAPLILTCKKETDAEAAKKKAEEAAAKAKLPKIKQNYAIKAHSVFANGNEEITFGIQLDPNKTPLNNPELVFSVSVLGDKGAKTSPIYTLTNPVKNIAKFIIKKGHKDFDHFKEGNPVLGVAMATLKDKKPTDQQEIGKIVLYDSKEFVKIKSKTPTTIKSPLQESQSVELEFVPHAAIAFPNLSDTPLIAYAAIDDNTIKAAPVEVGIEPLILSIDKNNIAKISLKVTDEQEANYLKLEKEALQKGLKLTFKFEKLPKKSKLPDLSKISFKISDGKKK